MGVPREELEGGFRNELTSLVSPFPVFLGFFCTKSSNLRAEVVNLLMTNFDPNATHNMDWRSLWCCPPPNAGIGIPELARTRPNFAPKMVHPWGTFPPLP